jgi:hypothetical protein
MGWQEKTAHLAGFQRDGRVGAAAAQVEPQDVIRVGYASVGPQQVVSGTE